MANEKFKVKFGLAVGDTQATVDGTTGDINTNGSITALQNLDIRGASTLGNAPADTVTVNGDTLINNALTIGSGSGDTVTVNSQVTDNIAFTDNSTTTIRGISGTVGTNDYWKFGGGATGLNSGYAVIATGDDGNEPIYVQQYAAGVPRTLTLMDASGNTGLAGDLTVAGSGYIYSSTGLALDLTGADVRTPGDLTIDGGNLYGSSALEISTTSSNGNLTLAPNGTGDVLTTFSNGGNLFNNRNYVFGAIRNSTTEGLGDMWAVNSTTNTQPFRGVSLDNSADTTKLPGYLARSYSNTSTFRGRLIFERARFTSTVATPAAVASGDFLGEVGVTGYATDRWINDAVTAVPGFFGFTAAETWNNTTAADIKCGTTFALSLQPTATNLATGTQIAVFTANPQALTLRADTYTFGQGKTGTANYLSMDSTKITAAIPFVFPSYTIAGKPATGAVGWQIAISDSPTYAGRMAYWSTTATAAWRYVDDNTAV